MDTYAHDGSAWKKLKHIYAHDGTDWRKLKEVWERGRCVYQDREFVEINSAGFLSVVNIVLDSGGDILAATNLGIYRYNVASGTWSAIGSFGSARTVVDISGTIYASSGSQVRRWTGSAWVAAHSNFLYDNVYSLERCAAGLLIVCGGYVPKIISAGQWVNYGTRGVQSAQFVSGTCYGISYGGDLYNVDSGAVLCPAGGPGLTDPSLTFHAISSSEMYFSGTYGVYKWDGSTCTGVLGSDSRLPRATYLGWPIGIPTFARKITAYRSAALIRPVGDQTLLGNWNSLGCATGLNIGDTIYMIINRTTPTRQTVHEFRLK